jgi:hypothetical protein
MRSPNDWHLMEPRLSADYDRCANEARDVVAGREGKGGKAVAIQAYCSLVADFLRSLVLFSVEFRSGSVELIGHGPYRG